MPEPLALPSYDDLDELVDTDPIRLRDRAWQLRCEAARLAADLKRATEVVAAVRQVTGGGYLPPAWSYKWRERAETAEAEVDRLKAELVDLEGQNALTESHFNNHVAESIVEQNALTKRAEAAETERDRLKAQVSLMGTYLQRESMAAIDKALAERMAGQ